VALDIAKSENEFISYLIGMPKIDSHTHIGNNHSAEMLFRMLESVNMRWLSVCYGGTRWEELLGQLKNSRKLNETYPDRFAWVTSFNLTNWGVPAWRTEALEMLRESFAAGAIAVKVWKEIGMSLQDPGGSYVMIDDPRFDPVFDFIRRRNKTLIAHIGEPKDCWLPLEQMLVEGDRDYYRAHPWEHCYGKNEIPDYWKQVESMDRVVERYPTLRVVRCHLASLEFEIDELKARLNKCPNMAVDLASRINHLQIQDREKVREFFLEYQDRILYATDMEPVSKDIIGYEEELQGARDTYIRDLIYFATDWEMEFPGVKALVRGLGLPVEVLEKIFYTNAKNWYPGI
jgi:predicted TIM-barrel fold metal-dependent hydrolase